MIIAISGKINSGKDLVGQIIQIITSFPEMSTKRILEHIDKKLDNHTFEIKKFANALKDMLCILLSCTREQLESNEFKNKELGEEWWYYNVQIDCLDSRDTTKFIKSTFKRIFISKKEAGQFANDFLSQYHINCIKPTPRLLLQLLGTECGREILHPNIWVNALFSKYKYITITEPISQENINKYPVGSAPNIQKYTSYPNWIITDLRFPNELKAVEERNGITIRINRNLIVDFHGTYVDETYKNETHKVGKNIKGTTKYNLIPLNEHESETALDEATFDYIIDNNGTIEDLINNVRNILIKEKII